MKPSGPVLLVVALLVAPLGCDTGGGTPPLSPVSGTITMDGKPLAGARVFFAPEAEGTVSSGGTDSSGRYELFYGPRGEARGAVRGKHTVRVEIMPDQTRAEAPLPIPAKYNEKSKLSRKVKDGPNTFDFKLESK